MTNFRFRLIFTLTALIITVLLALGLILGQLFKGYFLNTFNERLEKETLFISLYIKENGGLEDFFKEGKADNFTRILDSNVTIISTDGSILFDSNEKTGEYRQEHKRMLSRILEKKGIESEGFEVSDGGSDLHYYWKEIESNGEPEGYVILNNQLGVIKEANRHMWGILSISLGSALILIIMLGVKIASRYTRPIEAARKTAIQLAKGNYKARTYEEKSDETGMLSTSINILARNLQEMEVARAMQQDRLVTLIENIGSCVLLIDNKGYVTLINRSYKHLFKVIGTDFLYKLYYEVIQHKEIIQIIEEIFVTEKSLRRQLILPVDLERKHFEVYGAPIIGTNDEWKGILIVFHDITELKKLEQIRKDFVANVSHELKTPITSIKGFSETLLDGALNDKETLENFLGIILKESNRLQILIQELLDLSKIEQHEFTLNIEKLDIKLLLQETCDILDGKALQKEIELNIASPEHQVFIEGDSFRLKQAFINLITNALTYTSNSGRVDVIIKDERELVRIEIKDTGIGIEKEELPRIFERFYRVDRGRGRNSGGTGLGLAIVKHIVEAHKGQIYVESKPGEGSTFIVELQK
ncbi:PAS domain-containing sensor histidine kinase [Bacillus sp. M6-12]|uniref:two-component system histidine kinase PnpS n=1 Tax=Bacillus sp. M6-12 TaxID=2054166 RepID=UPI000C75E3C7|nr:ATP-binding protein [Bacillus sp. M6-12]PLS16961.1 PAS domain-containing sensor histidine kinase [Bacillus sp. M6-12]